VATAVGAVVGAAAARRRFSSAAILSPSRACQVSCPRARRQLQARPRRMMTLSRLRRGSHRARTRRARSPCAPSRCHSARVHRLRSPPNQLRKAPEFSRPHIRLASNRRRVRPSGPAVRQYLQALSMTHLLQALLLRLFPVAHRLVRRDSRHAQAHQQ
jgi:hypothetical protein